MYSWPRRYYITNGNISSAVKYIQMKKDFSPYDFKLCGQRAYDALMDRKEKIKQELADFVQNKGITKQRERDYVTSREKMYRASRNMAFALNAGDILSVVSLGAKVLALKAKTYRLASARKMIAQKNEVIQRMDGILERHTDRKSNMAIK